MPFDVHVLGTASARPTGTRSVSGSIVKCTDGTVVVDAGEGFQERYSAQRKHLKTKAKGVTLKPSDIAVLAFTHGHLDHTWGALPWLQSMDLEHRQQPLLILGPTSSDVIDALLEGTPLPKDAPPAELARQWRAWLELGAQYLAFPVRWVLGDPVNDRWIEMNPSTFTGLLLDDMPQPQGWKICSLRAVPTTHSVPSCAWMIGQGPTKGAFDRERAKALNLSTDERTQLAKGQDVEMKDGTALTASSFRLSDHAPTSVMISGDTASMAQGFTPELAPTLLVHEATFLEEQQEKAEEHLHSTAKGAVRSAHHLNAGVLALTHYSSRIKSSRSALDEALQDADDLPVVALEDGDRMVVEDDGKVTHLIRNEDGWQQASIAPNR